MIDGEPTAADLIRWARTLISSPDRWCRGAMSRDSAGRIVDYHSPEACSWCGHAAILLARGAIDAVFGPEIAEDCYLDAMDAIERTMRETYNMGTKPSHVTRAGKIESPARPISWVNDRRGHDQLLALFYRAEFRAAEEEEPLSDDELASLALDAVAAETGELTEPISSPTITRKMAWSSRAGASRTFRPGGFL